jgi:hypothetical protein
MAVRFLGSRPASTHGRDDVGMNWIWAAGVGVVVVIGLVSRLGERSGTGGADTSSGPPTPEQIDQLVRAGRKIEAIKAYRALHGVDLKDAKDAIDARARQLGR